MVTVTVKQKYDKVVFECESLTTAWHVIQNAVSYGIAGTEVTVTQTGESDEIQEQTYND